ncbi:hypothetical protein SAMN06272781_6476 [Streptomyces sp. 1222.2]|uniref:hypothetical protein n=1 Tax=Streptomyces sp. 1222.2 TaxID=1938833 RepID=UPI000BCDC728|nr:hypothetical protein [Streptomyces sp. 1222.2]SOD79193.1 hypothetical protein SAMN06272781_6476 [Streptomyces sp. 1222.2]
MFGTLLDKATGWLDRQLITTILLPVLAFGVGVAALIATNVGWSDVDHWWTSLTGLQQVFVCGGAVAALLVFGWLVEIAIPVVIRAYEGYWPRWLAPLARSGAKLQTWRRTMLEIKVGVSLPRPEWRYRGVRPLPVESAEGAREFARLHQEFPPPDDHGIDPLLPTRLGNAMRAAERYPNDRYGVDGVFFWPRLYGLLPDALLTPIGTARVNLERMLVISSLSALFSMGAVVFAGIGLPFEVWVPCLGGAVLLSGLAYRAAVAAVMGYGELVRAAFDTHRKQLLTTLGPEPPTYEERALWHRLGRALYRRESDSDEGSDEPIQLSADHEPARWAHLGTHMAAGAAGLLAGAVLGTFTLKRNLRQHHSWRSTQPSAGQPVRQGQATGDRTRARARRQRVHR